MTPDRYTEIAERLADAPYFHKLTDDEFNEAKASGKHYEDFKQPDWCGYPNAMQWMLGCWSLTEKSIKCIKDCGNCECIINDKTESK